MRRIEIDVDTFEQFAAVCDEQGRDPEFSVTLLLRWATENPEEFEHILS